MRIRNFFEGRTGGAAKKGQETDFEKWTGEVGEDTDLPASHYHEKKHPHLELVVDHIPVVEKVDVVEVGLEQKVAAAQAVYENAKRELEAYQDAKNEKEARNKIKAA